jgi:prepilin-type N-terminal cleavage/methylation domain-containing protein
VKKSAIKNAKSGFTLVEVLLSITIMGIMVVAISTIYASGLRSAGINNVQLLLDSHHRSKMEELLTHDFDALVDGSEVISAAGKNFTVLWKVKGADLDGDSTPEATAKLITVTLDGRSLNAIVVDDEGRIGKI